MRTNTRTSSVSILNVLIRLDDFRAYDRGVIRGIARYNNVEHRWRLHGQPHHASPPLSKLSEWRGDGIIGRFGPDDHLPEGCCAVNVCTAHRQTNIPLVGTDSVAVGRMAAEHLLEKGLASFGFVGIDRFRYSRLRAEGFADRLHEESSDLPCRTFSMPVGANWDQEQLELQNWLEGLASPVGIAAAMDALALRVLDAARSASLAVPEQVAVLGVDDDSLLCEVASPPLSSIRTPCERIGYEAAALLARLMGGEPAPKEPLLLPSLGVSQRASTEMTAIEDELVSRTLYLIRSTPPADMNLTTLFAALPASRRTVERRFKKAMGHTVWREYHRHRLRRAQELLAQTELSLERVAAASGFSDAKQLGAAFRDDLGTTPTACRKSHRAE